MWKIVGSVVSRPALEVPGPGFHSNPLSSQVLGPILEVSQELAQDLTLPVYLFNYLKRKQDSLSAVSLCDWISEQ